VASQKLEAVDDISMITFSSHPRDCLPWAVFEMDYVKRAIDLKFHYGYALHRAAQI
jgi:hypothetical protein